jgi:hypothetical protein
MNKESQISPEEDGVAPEVSQSTDDSQGITDDNTSVSNYNEDPEGDNQPQQNKDIPDILSLIKDLQQINNNVNNNVITLNKILDLFTKTSAEPLSTETIDDKDIPDVLSLIKDLQQINENMVNKNVIALNGILDLFTKQPIKPTQLPNRTSPTVGQSILQQRISTVVGSPSSETQALMKTQNDIKPALSKDIKTPPASVDVIDEESNILGDTEDTNKTKTCEYPFAIIDGVEVCYNEKEKEII